MPAIPTQTPDVQAVTMVIIAISSLCVIYWRMALRIVAVALMALTIYGAVLVFYGLHHIAR
jgi:hypothetical protein